VYQRSVTRAGQLLLDLPRDACLWPSKHNIASP
jgi:hypothetical protein